MLESIVTHSGIMPTQYRIATNCEHGRTFKERIQNAKRVTDGAIFRNSSSRPGQIILEVQCERKEHTKVKARRYVHKEHTRVQGKEAAYQWATNLTRLKRSGQVVC